MREGCGVPARPGSLPDVGLMVAAPGFEPETSPGGHPAPEYGSGMVAAPGFEPET